jgi:hypothetical protein
VFLFLAAAAVNYNCLVRVSQHDPPQICAGLHFFVFCAIHASLSHLIADFWRRAHTHKQGFNCRSLPRASDVEKAPRALFITTPAQLLFLNK